VLNPQDKIVRKGRPARPMFLVDLAQHGSSPTKRSAQLAAARTVRLIVAGSCRPTCPTASMVHTLPRSPSPAVFGYTEEELRLILAQLPPRVSARLDGY
jgi:hypothetical protein